MRQVCENRRLTNLNNMMRQQKSSFLGSNFAGQLEGLIQMWKSKRQRKHDAQVSYKFTINTCINELAWCDIMMHTENTQFKHAEYFK